MFRAIISPILKSTRLCLWYNAPTVLPAGDLAEDLPLQTRFETDESNTESRDDCRYTSGPSFATLYGVRAGLNLAHLVPDFPSLCGRSAESRTVAVSLVKGCHPETF